MEAPIYLFVDNHQLLLGSFSISTEVLVQKDVILMFLLIVFSVIDSVVEYVPLLTSTYRDSAPSPFFMPSTIFIIEVYLRPSSL